MCEDAPCCGCCGSDYYHNDWVYDYDMEGWG